MTCKTCNKAYIGQTSRNLTIRYREHIRYIKNNDPQSAYALHILNNRHEYGPLKDTMELLKPINNSLWTINNPNFPPKRVSHPRTKLQRTKPIISCWPWNTTLHNHPPHELHKPDLDTPDPYITTWTPQINTFRKTRSYQSGSGHGGRK